MDENFGVCTASIIGSQVLAGGKAVLLSVRQTSGTFDDGRIDVLSLQNGRRKTLQRGAMFGRYLATSKESGYLVYVNKGTVFGVPFDLDRLEVRGTPSPVLEDVGYSSASGAAQINASQNGTLVYRGGSAGGQQNLDIAPDGKRFVAVMPAAAPDEQ